MARYSALLFSGTSELMMMMMMMMIMMMAYFSLPMSA
jgi:hypothetical protein